MDNPQGILGTIVSAQFLLGPIMDSLKRIEGALTLIGLYYTTKLVLSYSWSLLKSARIYVFEPLFGKQRDWVKEYGRWAVITGATDGLGLEYARQLAKKQKMNIVLISRSMDKLTKAADEISKDYGVQTKVICVDFSGDLSIYKKIAVELDTIEVGLLVNNVGVCSPYPMPVGEQDPVNLWQHVAVNVAAVTMMTRLVIPQMVHRRKGGIINLASAASIVPVPLLAVYSATKIYNVYFTDALKREYEKYGITIQCLTPFYIATNMTKFSDRTGTESFFVPTARQFVQSALATFGHASACMGCLPHAIQYAGQNLCPTSWFRWYSYFYQRVLRAEVKKKAK